MTPDEATEAHRAFSGWIEGEGRGKRDADFWFAAWEIRGERDATIVDACLKNSRHYGNRVMAEEIVSKIRGES